jgi:hypothetical protein
MKKVSYLNSNKELVSKDFYFVKTSNAGAYFYNNNEKSYIGDLVLFLPITSAFIIENREFPLCLVQPK